jgi:hypothetical protein
MTDRPDDWDQAWEEAHADDDLDDRWQLEPDPNLDPTDLLVGDRILRVLARVERDRVKVHRLHDRERQVIDEWLEDRLRILNRQAEYARAQAELWMRAHAKATGARTVKLPGGELRLRPARTRVEVDSALFQEAAKVSVEVAGELPVDWLRVRVEPDKQAIGGAVEAVTDDKGVLEPSAALDFDGVEWLMCRAVEKETGQVVDDWLHVLVPREPDRVEVAPRTFELIDGES